MTLPAEPDFAELLPQHLPRKPVAEPCAPRDLRVAKELDLHGYSRDEALRCLRAFVRAGAAAGHRQLLVVHGRGAHSEAGAAVLRPAVRSCLREQSMRAWVRTIKPSAKCADGATTIYLRRVVGCPSSR